MSAGFKIKHIDFGRRDARHFITSNQFDAEDFSKGFLKPSGLRVSDFEKGKKSFIYGIKGSGKSALLKFLQIQFAKDAITKNIYFTEETTSRTEVSQEDVLNAQEVLRQKSFKRFWIYFFLSALGRALTNSDCGAPEYVGFIKANSVNNGFFSSMLGASPTLAKWVASFKGGLATVEASGGFENARQAENELDFLDKCIECLVRFPLKKSVFLFVDEVEVSFSSQESFQNDVDAARQLILATRTVNEAFRNNGIPVFVICSLRKEVADKIYGEEIGKIMRDLGHEVTWARGTWQRGDDEYLHPLFEIVLRRIALSQNPNLPTITQSRLMETKSQFFPMEIGTSTQREILDLTTYRPRDLVVLFESAQKVDGELTHFRPATFRLECRRNYRDLLWSDFADALRSIHTAEEIELFRKILFQLPHEFFVNEFLNKLEDFSLDPRIANLIESENSKWVDLLQDLYEIGAVGNYFTTAEGKARYRFHNRGDTDGLYIAKGYKIAKCKGLQNV